MIECESCGNYVSKRYARVYSAEGLRVKRCPDCSTKEERMRGAVAFGEARDRHTV